MSTQNKVKLLVAGLAMSAAGFTALMGHEGFRSAPYVPTQGDRPTIGFGSTVYETGAPVKMTDAPITRERALQMARSHINKDEAAFRRSLPGVKMTQGEYDLYLDFAYNFGTGNWAASSMRKNLLAGNYRQACQNLLMWRRQDGRDCSLSQNWGPKGCKGVWTRQQERHAKCLAEQ